MPGALTPNFLYDYLDIVEEKCVLGRPWWLWASWAASPLFCCLWVEHLTWCYLVEGNKCLLVKGHNNIFQPPELCTWSDRIWNIWTKNYSRKQILVLSIVGNHRKLAWVTSNWINNHDLRPFFFFFWSVVDLQCCVRFWCTAKWFSYTYIVLFYCRLFQDIEYSHQCYVVEPCCFIYFVYSSIIPRTVPFTL